MPQLSKTKVKFDPVVYVHHMYVWKYAYKQHRTRYWENFAVDRCRFSRRIAQFEQMYISIVIANRLTFGQDTRQNKDVSIHISR